MIIAEEVDSQSTQAMNSYLNVVRKPVAAPPKCDVDGDGTAACAPIALPHLVEENGPEGNLPFGHCFRKDSSYAKCVYREVAVAREGRAGSGCRSVRYDSLGLNKKHFDASKNQRSTFNVRRDHRPC
jgi:hypothetical protein